MDKAEVVYRGGPKGGGDNGRGEGRGVAFDSRGRRGRVGSVSEYDGGGVVEVDTGPRGRCHC